MGDQLQAAQTADGTFHMHTYGRKPVLFVEGQGVRLFDDDGHEYLDFVSGLGVVNLGHSHPAVVQAVCEQTARLTHVSNLYHVEHQAELAEVVSDLAGGDRKVFFANSGTEACEGAIKLARKWGRRERGESCTHVVTALKSFHGRTMGSLAATGQPAKHTPFAPMLPGFSHVPLNDIGALEAALTDDTCAVMLEPVQGEGGVHLCEPEYLPAVESLCRERGILLVADEVQSGCYRTGWPLAHQAYGVRPQIVTMAKALANGLPVGAVIADADVAEAFEPGDHGSTFGGGPVVCAAALATLEALAAQDLGDSAAKLGTYLMGVLETIGERTGVVTEVRGTGLMCAVQLEGVDAAAVADAALARGVLVNNIGSDIIRFLPPLVVTESEVEMMGDTLSDLLASA
jgi:predicted acetylornithine/succinylornithine family transaminase